MQRTSGSLFLVVCLLFVLQNSQPVFGVTVLTYPGICGAIVGGVPYNFGPLVLHNGQTDYLFASVNFNICGPVVSSESLGLCPSGTAVCQNAVNSIVPSTIYTVSTVTYGLSINNNPTIIYNTATPTCTGGFAVTTIELVCNQTATTPVVIQTTLTNNLCSINIVMQAASACPVGFSTGPCTTFQNGEFYNFNPLTVTGIANDYFGYFASQFIGIFFNICGTLSGATTPASCLGVSACSRNYYDLGNSNTAIFSADASNGNVPQLQYQGATIPSCPGGSSTYIDFICNPSAVVAPTISFIGAESTSCRFVFSFQSIYACPNPLLHLPASPYVLPKFNTTIEFLVAGVQANVMISFMGLPYQSCRTTNQTPVSVGGNTITPQRVSCPAPNNPLLSNFVGTFVLRFKLISGILTYFPGTFSFAPV